MSGNNPALDPGFPGGNAGGPRAEGVIPYYQTHYYNPHFRITLVNRDTGKDYGIDVNRDVMSINTQKRLGDPAGMWALTLNPRRLGGASATRSRTWAEVARPMDYVEIALGLFRGVPPITIMRGFVDNARYVNSLDGNGNPARRVLLSGRDMGKLGLAFKIFYLVELSQYVGGAVGLLEQFYDFPFKFFTPNEFFGTVADKLLLRFLAKLQANNAAIPTPAVRGSIPDMYQVNPVSTDLMSFQGSVYNLLAQFASQPYTENFWRDLPGGPEWVWRWAPLLKPGNLLPLPDHASFPTVRTVHTTEIVAHDMGRSDNPAVNYLWAPPTVFGGTGSQEMKVISPGYIDKKKIDLFGFRPFEPPFNLYRLSTGDPKHEQALTETVWGGQIDRCTRFLADTMLPNDTFFEGSVQSHLRPDILMGEYADLPEFGQRCYVEGVEHTYVVGDGPSMTTILTLTRGQAIDAPLDDLPGSYRYDPAKPGEVPGISTHAAAPTRAAAGQSDRGATGGEPNKNTSPGTSFPPDPTSGGVVAALAQQLIGAPYEHSDAWQQDDVTVIFRKGIDCSQLVSFCYRRGKGVTVPAHAQTQYDTMSAVAEADLTIGDALFFTNTVSGTGEYVTHSSIYIGSGQHVSADDYPTGVRLHTLRDGYWDKHFVGGGRA